MGRGGGGGGGGSFGGGGFSGGGGGHIGGGFSGGRVGGSSHSSGGSWGSSHSSGGSGWSGSRSSSGWGSSGYSSGSGYRNYNSSGSGLFPPLWWWIWGGGSTRNNSYNELNRQKYNNNNNNGGQDPKKKEPEKKEPEKKKSSTVGCLSVILILVAIILAFVMIAGISSAKNAKNRTKLDKKITVDIGYLDDELGWIDNKSLVEKSMKSFYDQTGVMPYLIITDNIGSVDPQSESQTQALAQSVYNSLFGSDDAHFLVLWYQKNGNDDYAFMYSGTSANGVIDADARKVVMNYFNRYYTSDYDDSHYFAKVFEDSAEEIMLQADTGWKTTLLLLVLVIGVLIAMNVIDYKNTMKIKKQEAAAKILNANIEDPGWKDEAETLSEKYSDEASELASKYEDKK